MRYNLIEIKTMKKNALFFTLFIITVCGFAQAPAYDFNKFTPLQSSGNLPQLVSMSGNDFITGTRKNIDLTKGNRKDRKAQKQFAIQSSYSIKDLFTSGKVLYNSPISHYVENVHKVVTAGDVQLATETRVFVIKSSVVNAFATNQGYIFITTGLLAQLENEAQLAFILCHEMVHYKNKHVVNAYVENQRIDRERAAYRNADIDSRFLQKANYSRENESEADSDGFELFAKTKYNLKAIDGLFDVLKYSLLPFDDIKFKTKNIFETSTLVFPEEYIMVDVDDVDGIDEDEDDSNSTHPNLKKRRNDIEDKISSFTAGNAAGGLDFIVSESAFLEARKLARFDLCHTSLLNRNYDQALYQAYCLLQSNPNNIYLNKIILKALYGLSMYANSNKLFDVAEKYKNVKGESQALNFLLQKLSDSELNAIALHFAWRLKKSLPANDVEVDVIIDDLFYSLVKNHYSDMGIFSRDYKGTVQDSINTLEKSTKELNDNTPLVKSVKLKKQEKNINSEYFLTYAFVDMFKDADFVDTYKRATKKANKPDINENEFVKKKKRKKDLKEDAPLALGIDTVMVLNPFYLKIDERKKNPVLFAGSDKSQKEFNNKIQNIAGHTNIILDILDKTQLDTSNVVMYNEMALLADWVEEREGHGKLNLIPTDYIQITDIAQKYNTNYLALMGTVSYIERRENLGFLIAATIIMPVWSWPLTIPFMVKKNTLTFVYTVVYDVKTGERKMVKTGITNLSDNNDVIMSFLYNHMQQISTKPSTNSN